MRLSWITVQSLVPGHPKRLTTIN